MTAAAFPALPLGGVLVASANVHIRDRVLSKLQPGGGPIHIAAGGAEALAKLDSGNWQTLILDRQLPDLDAEELMGITERQYPGIRVMLMDSWADDQQESVEPVRPHGQPARSPQTICDALPGMIGDSEPMREMYRMVRLVARRNTTVLVTGPTGSGKELVARAIHRLSGRADSGFAVLNCAAIPETLIESELFGYTRGAFTGATQTYGGKILSAQGGTLFLDEIGELPLGAQAKILRFLEQKEIQRLGSSEITKVDLRVVAATNRDLAAAVEGGNFREDLFFRIAAFPIHVCPLRERGPDILRLSLNFLEQLGGRTQSLRLAERSKPILEAHLWPGNVRELQQVLERAAILAGDGREIFPEHLVFSLKASLARKAG